jgi:PKD repeat protein
VAGLCLAAGCHQRAFVVTGMDAAATDGSPDAQTTLTLDISVTGCANLSVGGATAVSCSGPVPLTVSFAPVGSAALTTFRWMFGDRSPSSMDPAPTHTYTLPGSYTVMVTGEGTVGTVSRVRENLISVLALAAGASCDVDSQCGQGLRCLCQPGAGCPAAFTRGICTTACATGFCGAGAVCADYPLPAAAGGADGGDDAAAGAGLTATCLADCSSTSCPSGFVCQSLPAAGQGSAGWVEACLPLGAAHDLGASCRGADGALHDAACSTGLCANLGDLGMCSAPCDGAHPCPAGSGCARLAGLPAPVCLPSCSASAPCAPDPAIGCAAAITADAGTDGGVPIISGALDASYCAPF